MRDASFKAYVREQLEELDRLVVRPMFGGLGLYLAGRFFGIVYEGRLYFRTDDESRASYVDRGALPFRPRPGRRLGTYYEVPAEILDDAEELAAWAARAAGAARRTTPKRGRRAATRSRGGS